MSKSRTVKLRVNDLKRLMSWISTLEDKNFLVEITEEPMGIGVALEASVEIEEGRGVWIDLTDYENW